MNYDAVIQKIQATALHWGLQILAAIAFWVIGRWLIGVIVDLVRKALEKQKVDPTLLRYIGSFISVTLNILLVIAILGYFGVETTSFAALAAGIGIAIGAAWGGLLSNFAAGAFLIVLRPFKVGDFVSAGGVTGTIKEIGLFATAFNTPDNVLTTVGNSRIFADNIQNFTVNPYRRVDLTAQLSYTVDPRDAIARLKPRIAAIANVMQDPAPDVELLEFTASGPVLAVRPYCHNDHYWQVFFDSNITIRDTFGEAGYAVPAQPYEVRQK